MQTPDPANSHDQDRAAIARAAADALAEAAATLADRPALVGFDGFVDEIIHVVDRRNSMALEDFERIKTIPEFAARANAAAGKSANIELVPIDVRFGGNGPLMAGALGRLGQPVTYIGAVANDPDSQVLMPLFVPFAERCREVVPIAAPGHTDALEFEDGKLMFGKPAAVQAVTWDRLKQMVGLDVLRARIARARTLGIVNWTLCGGVESIWQGLIDEVLPDLAAAGQAPSVFIDLSDPAKRTDEDIARALDMLGALNALAPVTLGLNLAESERIARVLDAGAYADPNAPLADSVRDASERILRASGLDAVVVHPRQGAGAATAEPDARGVRSAWFAGPFTANPKLSTGAGDHFNAGFAFAQACGLHQSVGLDACLATATAVSGAYVRDALSPDLERLVAFLRDLPAPAPQ
ncbi:MAG: carbohydrate kinase family protein [Planctomycetota bacterium]